MDQRHRAGLFDNWAENYDQSIQDHKGFPFDGYGQVLDEITRASGANGGMKVLDLGIGTGNLTIRFASLGCEIWGIDFSVQMLTKASEKLPQAVLVQADLLGEWPTELDHRFDRIVSAYVLHEFDLPTKVNLLQGMIENYLAAKGRIVIGDIAFPTTVARDKARRKWADLWDEEEYYWAADEVAVACERVGLHIRVGHDPSHLEFLLNESRNNKWWFRKNSLVTRPLGLIGWYSETGIPFLCPEVVLLYKAISKKPMPKNEDDFDNVRERLSNEQREWLRRAIESCNSKHVWLERLS